MEISYFIIIFSIKIIFTFMRDPLVYGTRDPPPPSDLTGKVYEGIHTLPPFGFEPVTS